MIYAYNFDYDGVLRSISWEGIFKAYKELARYKNKDHQDFFKNIEELKEWFNPDWRINLERLGGFDDEELDTVNEIYHSCYDPHVGVFEWAENILSDLSTRHTLALLSASSAKSIYGSIGSLQEFFSLIVCNDHVARIKPDPEGVYLIINKLKSAPDNTVIIGDTEADILAGKSAGIKTGAVKWGGITPWQELMDLKPDYAFHEPDELFSL